MQKKIVFLLTGKMTLTHLYCPEPSENGWNGFYVVLAPSIPSPQAGVPNHDTTNIPCLQAARRSSIRAGAGANSETPFLRLLYTRCSKPSVIRLLLIPLRLIRMEI